MSDESLTRPKTITATPGQTFRADRISIALAVLGVTLACALGAVLLVPDGESSAALPPTTATVSPTVPSTTESSTESTSTTTSGVPFSMPESLQGGWRAEDGTARATFSSDALLDLDAVVSGGDDSSIRYMLTRPSVIGSTPIAGAPEGLVLEGAIELNGVLRPVRAIGWLVPTDSGLELSFPLVVEQKDFDLDGSTTTVAVNLTMTPG